MFKYNSRNGEFTVAETGEFIGVGYSGHGDGRNNPVMANVRNVGPIPVGHYKIGKPFDQTPGKGPVVMRLYPLEGTETFHRDGFMIHGDNARNDASEGCIILNRRIREIVAASDDRILEVI